MYHKINYLPLQLVTLLTLSACSEQLDIRLDATKQSDEEIEIVDTRSPQEAIEAAQRALTLLVDPHESRANTQTRQIDTKCGAIRIGNNISRSSDDLPFYVVNYKDSLGYAIVAADRCVQELIAVTVDGHLENLSDTDNPGLHLFFDLATRYVEIKKHESQSRGDKFITPPFKPVTYRYYRTDTIWQRHVLPRTPNFWHQRSPLGDFCPNKVAGCANVALALALSYLEYPKDLILSYHDSVMGKIIHLDWPKLKTHKHFEGYYSQRVTLDCYQNPDKDLIHYQLAHLGRQLGHWNNSSYKYTPSTSTSTNTNELLNNLKGLGLHGVLRDYHTHDASDALTYSPVILMLGKNNLTGIGHMWICDGVRSYSLKRSLWEEDQFGNHVQLTDWEVIPGSTYNFINWGWGEDIKPSNPSEPQPWHNGWYLDNVFSVTVHNNGAYSSEGYINVKYITITF